MTTLNTRAREAWIDYADRNMLHPFDAESQTFEEGWGTGYKTARADEAERIATVLEEAADDLDMPTMTEWLELRSWFKQVLHGVAAVVREEVPS